MLKYTILIIFIFNQNCYANNFHQLMSLYCNPNFNNTELSECRYNQNGKLLNVDHFIKILCVEHLTKHKCSNYEEKLSKLGLTIMSCPTDDKTRTCQEYKSDAAASAISCAFQIASETIEITQDLITLPINLTKMINKSFENDEKCFYDKEKKYATIDSFNKIVPKEFQISDSYTKLEKGKPVGPLLDWPCQDIKNLLRTKTKEWHDYLANPKNSNDPSRKNYKANDGAINNFFSEEKNIKECLSPTNYSEYLCKRVAIFLTNIFYGKVISIGIEKLKPLNLKDSYDLIPKAKGGYSIISSVNKKFSYETTNKAGSTIPLVVESTTMILKFRNGSELSVVIPNSMKYPKGFSSSKEYALSLIDELPLQSLQDSKKIVFSPGTYYFKDQKQAASGLYFPDELISYVNLPTIPSHQIIDILRHELGHHEGFKINPSKGVADGYSKSKEIDKNSVSAYGDTSIKEDFAEAAMIYLRSEGGTKNPELLKKHSARFEILDMVYKIDPEKRKRIFDKVKQQLEDRKIKLQYISNSALMLITGEKLVIVTEEKE